MFSLKWRTPFAIILATVFAHVCSAAPPAAPANAISYPVAQRTTDGTQYHGTTVPDPYRWLETHQGVDTQAWLLAQKTLARKHFDGLPQRAKIATLAEETLDYARQTVPMTIAGKVYFARNSGLQDNAVIYRAKSIEDEAPEVVLNLNQIYPDAIRTLRTWSVSGDGNYLAYSVYLYGSDKAEWRIRSLQTLTDYAEVLTSECHYPSWHASLAGFYHSLKGTVWFHRIGTSAATDQQIYTDATLHAEARTTSSGRYVVLTLTSGTKPGARILLRDLQGQGTPNYVLVPTTDNVYDFICEANGSLYFLTTSNAPKARIVAMSLQQLGTFTELVPEADDALDSVSYVAGSLFARYLHNGHHVVKVFETDGKEVATLDLPGEGTAESFTSDGTATGVLYSYSNFVTPPVVFRYPNEGDPKARQSKAVVQSTIKYEVSDFVQEVCTITSKDGTKVPMTLAYNKKLVKDGTSAALLYGYGGFHYSLTPRFKSENIIWLRLGGVLAMPNLRGGSELGEAWHDAGIKLKKQNVFDDYLAAAHWLVDQKYTSAGKIVSSGASNGGLLVAAATTQEPDLFGVALPDVGVLDMIRFAKLGGTGWVSDYGDVNDKAEFEALFKYSPLHRVKKDTHYPAVLVTAPDHDDRVNQAHSWKFTAAMQWAQGGDKPVLLSVTTDAGHVGGYTPKKLIQFYADRYAFCIQNCH